MNSSVYSADRATHLRIVVAALMASIGMVLFALAAHANSDASYAPLVRAQASQRAVQGVPAIPMAVHRT
jgi:hypothetical protein